MPTVSYNTDWNGIIVRCPQGNHVYPCLVREALFRIISRPYGNLLIRNIHSYPFQSNVGYKVCIYRTKQDIYDFMTGKDDIVTNTARRINEINATNGVGTSTAIMWNPNIINTPHGPRPPFIALAHELIHAWHNLRGDALPENRWEEMATVGLFQYENYRQITENKIRIEHGVSVRTTYEPFTDNYGWIPE